MADEFVVLTTGDKRVEFMHELADFINEKADEAGLHHLEVVGILANLQGGILSTYEYHDVEVAEIAKDMAQTMLMKYHQSRRAAAGETVN